MNTLHKSGGTVCRIVDFAPGNIPFMHRTSSLDYGVVLQGKIEYFLDDGASRVFGPGEVVIQRGVMHGWKTAGDEPVRMLVVVLAEEEAGSASLVKVRAIKTSTDLEGRWCSSNAMRADCCMMPDCGDARFDPDRPGRLKSPGGDVKLEVE
ncbi:Cupin-domain-containing oxidoreductase virC [Verticillium longisporum]|nr:Cupin-domain-containing oxidoreductase virC [Verticillium longisporum]